MKPSITIIILAIIGAAAGPVLALAGASLAGLPESAWGLEPLMYLFFGFLVGGPGFLLLLGVLTVFVDKPFANRALLAVGIALPLAFLSGLLGVPFERYNQAASKERMEIRAAESDRRYQEFRSILQSDPEIAVREKWYRGIDERRLVYNMSITNRDVNYSPATLARLYAVDDEMAPMLLRHPAFDPQLLEAEFHRMIKRGSMENIERLLAILGNPNTRDEWFPQVAALRMVEKDESLKLRVESLKLKRKSDPP
jgi:hypothetical protein